VQEGIRRKAFGKSESDRIKPGPVAESEFCPDGAAVFPAAGQRIREWTVWVGRVEKDVVE
jgi:hypothetical protein